MVFLVHEPAEFGFRYLRVSDIVCLVEWENRERPYPWTTDHFSETLRSESARTLILETDGKIIGYAVVQIVENEAYLQNIFISPDHRRRRVGFGFLQKLMIWTKQCGASSIMLDVEKGNEAAIRLYTRCGFQLLEEREKSYPRGETSLIMNKVL